MNTKIDVEGLRAKAEGASPGNWSVWREPTPTKYDAIAELADQVHSTDPFAEAVYLIDADGKCPATTGCGPTSEANAAYIVAAQPQTIIALLDRIAELERKLEQANQALDADADVMDALSAELSTLSGAQS